jgi:hypothetical protein
MINEAIFSKLEVLKVLNIGIAIIIASLIKF